MNGQLTEQVTEFPSRVPHAHSVFVQRTFCPFRIRYIFVLFVIHPLHVRELTVTCPVRMRFYRLPGRPSPPPRRLPSPDKYFLPFFCPFSVRCDSTIKNGIFFSFFFWGGGGERRGLLKFQICFWYACT